MKPIYAQFAGALALTAAVAACVPRAPAPQARPVATAPAPAPRPTPTPTPTYSSWIDAPQSAGNWTFQSGNGTTEARFGASAGEPRFAMRCNRANRQVTLLRSVQAPAPVAMTVRTESRSATLNAQPVSGAQPMVAATLPASDPLLDAMAITRGRFAIEVPGQPPLYIPAWAEVTRVIEDCR